MKNLFSEITLSNIAVAIVFILIFVTGSLMAQNTTISSEKMTTKTIDALWENAPYLQMNEKVADGMTIYNSVDVVDSSVKMAFVHLPKEFGSQGEDVYLQSDWLYVYNIPKNLSYQVVSLPKVINGKLVILAKIGMHNPEFDHFYIVFNIVKSGKYCEVYETEIMRNAQN